MKHITTWVFDLDQTLYHKSSGVENEVVNNLRRYVAAALNLSINEAEAKTLPYYKQYGATVLGLMKHDNVDPTHFIETIYWELPLSGIPKGDTGLRALIKSLPGRKVIFTNGSRYHAQRVLAHMGLDGVFDTIVDISVANYHPKPMREPFDAFFAETGIDPRTAAFFEDSVRNLEVGKSYGMTTLLVDEYGDTYKNQPFIDAVAPDVRSLLTKVLGQL